MRNNESLHEGDAQADWTRPIPHFDFDRLTVGEWCALLRLADDCRPATPEPDPIVGTPLYHWLLWESMGEYLDALPGRNLDRARALYGHLADCESKEDRLTLVWGEGTLTAMTLADHDVGLDLWDRLLRDEVWDVRDQAKDQFAAIVYHAVPDPPARVGPDGILEDIVWCLDHLDEALLRQQSGLSSAEARGLLESYLLAEQGVRLHNLGRRAVEKLLAKLPPRQ